MGNKSLLTRNESNAIKGLLIFLIVLGHNTFFTKNIPGFQTWLYCFHVQCFFALPFLYPSKKLCKESVANYFVRLYYPYIILFITYTILFKYLQSVIPPQTNASFIPPNDVSITGWLRTLFTGNRYLIEYFGGFQYLWFLPAMFSAMIIKQIYEHTICHKDKLIKTFFFLMSLVCYIMFLVFFYKQPYDKTLNYNLMQFSLFACLQGFGATFVGFSIQYIIKHYKSTYGSICIFIFLAISTLYFLLMWRNNEYLIWIMRAILPIIFFVLIYSYRQILSKSNILEKLGEYSFLIYVTHPIFCKISAFIIPTSISKNWLLIFLSQILITLASYYSSLLITKISWLRRSLFPNNTKELMGLLQSQKMSVQK